MRYYALFIFCLYTFLFNLEIMSNNVRKFRLFGYIWHLWRSVNPFLHLLYLIIYLVQGISKIWQREGWYLIKVDVFLYIYSARYAEDPKLDIIMLLLSIKRILMAPIYSRFFSEQKKPPQCTCPILEHVINFLNRRCC